MVFLVCLCVVFCLFVFKQGMKLLVYPYRCCKIPEVTSLTLSGRFFGSLVALSGCWLAGELVGDGCCHL